MNNKFFLNNIEIIKEFSKGEECQSRLIANGEWLDLNDEKMNALLFGDLGRLFELRVKPIIRIVYRNKLTGGCFNDYDSQLMAVEIAQFVMDSCGSVYDFIAMKTEIEI